MARYSKESKNNDQPTREIPPSFTKSSKNTGQRQKSAMNRPKITQQPTTERAENTISYQLIKSNKNAKKLTLISTIFPKLFLR